MRLGIVRLKLKGDAIMPYRLVNKPFGHMGLSEIKVRLRQAGLKSDGGLKVLNRLFPQPLFQVCNPDIVMRLCIIRP
jgi:hypothetical protein